MGVGLAEGTGSSEETASEDSEAASLEEGNALSAADSSPLTASVSEETEAAEETSAVEDAAELVESVFPQAASMASIAQTRKTAVNFFKYFLIVSNLFSERRPLYGTTTSF